jgi:hypothetical protein
MVIIPVLCLNSGLIFEYYQSWTARGEISETIEPLSEEFSNQMTMTIIVVVIPVFVSNSELNFEYYQSWTARGEISETIEPLSEECFRIQ